MRLANSKEKNMDSGKRSQELSSDLSESPRPAPEQGPRVHNVTVRVCQSCIDLVGEECHTPECVFCFRGMDEVKWLLDKMLICPVIDGERIILAGDAAPEWQPIETVPMRTDVLLWGYDLGFFTGNFHGQGARCDPDDAESEATHWQPLPDPPTEVKP